MDHSQIKQRIQLALDLVPILELLAILIMPVD